MELKNLRDLSSSDLKAFMDGIDNIILDIDGVVLTFHGQEIDGVAETCEKLNKLNKNIYFASNNNMIGFSNLHHCLTKIVPHLPKDNIMIPTTAIIAYLRNINFNKKIVIGGSCEMKEDFIKAGFDIVNTEDILPLPRNLGQFAAEIVKNIDNVGAVILDVQFNLNIVIINKMLHCLRSKDTLFLTGSKQTNIVLPGGVHILGIGELESVFVNMCNKKSISFGKPDDEFKHYVLQKLNGANPFRTLFVGDMLDADIYFGRSCGFQTLLVLTGVSQLKDLENCPKDHVPDFYLQSFGDLCNIFEKKLNL